MHSEWDLLLREDNGEQNHSNYISCYLEYLISLNKTITQISRQTYKLLPVFLSLANINWQYQAVQT